MQVQIDVMDRVAELLDALERHGQIHPGATQELLASVAFVAATVLAETLVELGYDAEAGSEPEAQGPFLTMGSGWAFRPPLRMNGKGE